MVSNFQVAAEAVGATVKRFNTIAEAIPYLEALADKGIVAASRLPDDILNALSGKTFALPKEAADAYLCISFAQAGIAATGSLLLDLSETRERAFTALPVVHAVFVKAATIVPDLYALHDLLSRELASPVPAYLSLTTGPSRTADIERVLTIGVHGPKELHILILEGE